MQIEKKIVLVTGGADGIGFACCKEFLSHGAAHVAVLDLPNSKGGEAVKNLNEEFGAGKAIFVICDVSKPQDLEAGFAKTVKEFGGLDVVFNNAGVTETAQPWELMIEINFVATVRGTLLGMQYMGKNKGGKGGTIINMSSIGGIVPVAHAAIYSGTKHGVIGLSRSLSLPYHHDKTGVRIITICPGATNTRLVELHKEWISKNCDAEETAMAWAPFPIQPVENVAQGVMHAFIFGETGSVWVADQGEPIYEVELPDRPVKKMSTHTSRDPSTSVKNEQNE